MQFRNTTFSPALVILFGMLFSCAEQPNAPGSLRGRVTPQAVSISPGVPTRVMSRTQRPDLSTRSNADVGILASTSAVTFRRSPGEGGGPTDMAVGGTAYFRDVLWEADYTITATNDGDFWDSNITFPSGAVAQFGTVTWHASFGGQSDCFVSGFSVLCGTTSADVRDMVSNQCGASGSYTYRLNQNGAQAFSGSFTLKPTLPPGTVSNQFQTDHRLDPYDSICKDAAGNSIPCPGTPDQIPQTIKDKGCALTAAVMLLGYFGIPTDPVTLNAYLLSLGAGGYTPGGGVIWDGLLQRFAQEGQFKSVRINSKATPADLRNRICRFGPQLVYVKSRQHFVLVTGLNDGETDFTIADPAAPPGTPGKTGLLNADYGGFRSIREFDPLSPPSLEDAILATLHSPAQLVVTDPLGRRVGYDPLRAITYAEIPAASYDSSGLGDLQDDGTIVDVDPESKELYIHLPADGQYAATVTGTGNGRYTLNLVAYDLQHRFARFLVSDVAISVGEVHQYAVLFNSADMSSGTLATSGGFNGGGQRTDINQLLSYARPGQGRTSLPAGTSTYSLLVFYDAAVDAGSFQADLNGVLVTSSFHPIAGGSESVSIPLQSGRNVLKLSVTGSPGGHTGTDHDQLVFLVP